MGRRWTVLLALLGLLAAGAGEPLEVATPSAGVVFLQGTVEVCTGKGSWSPAREGTALAAGDQLRTAADSMAVLVLWDGTTMTVADATHLKVVDLSQGSGGLVRRFQLQAGRVWSNVQAAAGRKSTFEVEGPDAVASVRGTAFEVTVEGDGTEIDVWEGQVEATSNGERTLLSRFQRLKARARQKAVLARLAASDAGPWQLWNARVRQKLQLCLRTMPRPLDPRKLTPTQRRCLRELYDSLPPGWQRRIREKARQVAPRPGGR